MLKKKNIVNNNCLPFSLIFTYFIIIEYRTNDVHGFESATIFKPLSHSCFLIAVTKAVANF